MEKLPPIEKVYEALSALADKRVTINGSVAKVKSSDFKKEYTVSWKENEYSSNDSATYWQSYAGYPIIAVLMLKNKLMYNENTAEYFKNINWKEINTKYKGKYDEALKEVFEKVKKIEEIDDEKIENIKKEIQKIYEQIKALNIIIKRGKLRPPK